MSEYATLISNHTLELPPAVAKNFQPSERFMVWVEGDTLYLRRIMPSPLKAVEHAPDEDPLSLDEINDIVHKIRQQRHN